MPILPFYDSMIAKVVAQGRDRDEARRRLVSGLDALVALGVPTNRRFLSRCIADPIFAAGGATTAFIAERADALADRVADGAHPLAALAALVLFQCASHHVDDRDGEPVTHPLAHRLPVPMRLQVGGAEMAASVRRSGARRVEVASASDIATFDLLEQHPTSLRFARDGVVETVVFVRDAEGAWLQHRGLELRVEDRTRAAPARPRAAGGDGTLRASMNGRVVAVMARAGDRVESGAPLVTLEAMKMEHVHVAPRAGVIRVVRVTSGQQVAAGSVVVELDAAEARDAESAGRPVGAGACLIRRRRVAVRRSDRPRAMSSTAAVLPLRRDAERALKPDAEGNATRAAILAAARAEFSAKGLSGARVRKIAERAGVNKQLLYYYFGSKDDLYRAALEAVYAEIRALERGLNLGDLPPLEAMAALIGFSFDYLARHPDFIGMLNHENAQGAEHVRQSSAIRAHNSPLIELIAATLKRGVAARVFRRGVDPVELYISIAGMSYFFFSNRLTLSSIFARDLAVPKREAGYRAHVIALALAGLRP